MAGCQLDMLAFFPSFFSHFHRLLFGSEQINTTLKVYLSRADVECGTVCCDQCSSMKFHKEKETKIAQESKFHNVSLLKKEISSGVWGPPLCVTKTRNEMKMPYSTRKQGKSQEDKGSPRKINVRKRMVEFFFFF